MAKLIGTDPNQVPTNGDLGTMAYQDYDVVAPQFLAGGRRNLIINGAMQVAQRGTSETNVGATSGYYTVDRWTYAGSTGARFTTEQSTDAPDNFANSFKFTTTTTDTLESGDWAVIQQRFEGQDIQHLGFGNSGTFTISFWVKSSIAGNYALGLYADDMTDKYTGLPYSVNLANTWEYKTLTFNAGADSIPNDNTVGLRIYFALIAGSNYTSGTSGVWGSLTNWFVGQDVNIGGTSGATFAITGVQLEVGSVATPFEHRSYGEELALCQRYYYNTRRSTSSTWQPLGTMGFCYASDTMYSIVNHPVEMRTTPTFTATGNVSGTNEYQVVTESSVVSNLTSILSGERSPLYCRVDVTKSGAFTTDKPAWLRTSSSSTTNYLEWDAEL